MKNLTKYKRITEPEVKKRFKMYKAKKKWVVAPILFIGLLGTMGLLSEKVNAVELVQPLETAQPQTDSAQPQGTEQQQTETAQPQTDPAQLQGTEQQQAEPAQSAVTTQLQGTDQQTDNVEFRNLLPGKNSAGETLNTIRGIKKITKQTPIGEQTLVMDSDGELVNYDFGDNKPASAPPTLGEAHIEREGKNYDYLYNSGAELGLILKF